MSWIQKVIAAVKTTGCPDVVDVPANYAGVVHTDSVSKATWVAGPGTYRVRLGRVAALSIGAAGTTTVVPWDTEYFDDGGFIAVPATVITIPTGMGGTYAITFQAQFGGSVGGAAGERAVLWAQSITNTVTGEAVNWRASLTGEDIATLAFVKPMNAGDQIQFQIYHTDASSPPSLIGAFLNMTWLGPNI